SHEKQAEKQSTAKQNPPLWRGYVKNHALYRDVKVDDDKRQLVDYDDQGVAYYDDYDDDESLIDFNIDPVPLVDYVVKVNHTVKGSIKLMSRFAVSASLSHLGSRLGCLITFILLIIFVQRMMERKGF